MITGLMFAMIGFKEVLPDVTTPYSTQLHYTGVFLMYGMIILGLLCNIIALKFYPLTKEKMEEIQSEIAAIKAANA
jgi:Na+/melibiose symporter-like transporter